MLFPIYTDKVYKGEGEGGVSDHTNTTRSHVSSNHDGRFAGLEFVENPVAFILLLVTVDGCREELVSVMGRNKGVAHTQSGPAVLSEESSDLVSNALGASEK